MVLLLWGESNTESSVFCLHMLKWARLGTEIEKKNDNSRHHRNHTMQPNNL